MKRKLRRRRSFRRTRIDGEALLIDDPHRIGLEKDGRERGVTVEETFYFHVQICFIF
jgi:hypothetical protein